MNYLAFKHLHITFVTLSISLFLLRGFWMWVQSPKLQQRWVKIAPHIIDTLLLASGITVAVVAHWNPAQQPWLAAKLVLLVLYIVLGTFALKRGKTLSQRKGFFIAALLTVAYMVFLAIHKSLLPF